MMTVETVGLMSLAVAEKLREVVLTRRSTTFMRNRYLPILGGELLAERCRTDDLLPSSLSLSLAFLHTVGPQSSEAEHPHQLHSARWFLVVQRVRVSSSLLVVLVQQQYQRIRKYTQYSGSLYLS